MKIKSFLFKSLILILFLIFLSGCARQYDHYKCITKMYPNADIFLVPDTYNEYIILTQTRKLHYMRMSSFSSGNPVAIDIIIFNNKEK